MKWSLHQTLILASARCHAVTAALGGRGAGRTTAAIAAQLYYHAEHGETQGIFLRQTYPSLTPVFEDAQRIAQDIGIEATPNKTELSLRLRNKSVLTLAPLETTEYFNQRFRGGSIQSLCADELATWPDVRLPLRMFGNLRHGSHRTFAILCSNPGPSGPVLHKQIIAPARRLSPLRPETPFACEWLGGKQTSFLFGTYRDNPNLPPDYLQNLRAASPSDAAFRRDMAGDFTAAEHALFTVLPHHVLQDWPLRWEHQRFPHIRVFIGYDHGTVAPWAAVWYARFLEQGAAPNGEFFPAGSYVAFAESHNANPDLGYLRSDAPASVAEIAQQLKNDADALGFAKVPPIYADDAVSSDVGLGSVLKEFKSHGVSMRPAGKRYVRGNIHRLNELMRNAAPAEGEEFTSLLGQIRMRRTRAEDGFYMSAHTPYLRTALESAFSTETMPDSISPRFALKHILDAAFYGALANTSPRSLSSEPLHA